MDTKSRVQGYGSMIQQQDLGADCYCCHARYNIYSGPNAKLCVANCTGCKVMRPLARLREWKSRVNCWTRCNFMATNSASNSVKAHFCRFTHNLAQVQGYGSQTPGAALCSLKLCATYKRERAFTHYLALSGALLVANALVRFLVPEVFSVFSQDRAMTGAL